jgi:hypothetical protein
VRRISLAESTEWKHIVRRIIGIGSTGNRVSAWQERTHSTNLRPGDYANRVSGYPRRLRAFAWRLWSSKGRVADNLATHEDRSDKRAILSAHKRRSGMKNRRNRQGFVIYRAEHSMNNAIAVSLIRSLKQNDAYRGLSQRTHGRTG